MILIFNFNFKISISHTHPTQLFNFKNWFWILILQNQNQNQTEKKGIFGDPGPKCQSNEEIVFDDSKMKWTLKNDPNKNKN